MTLGFLGARRALTLPPLPLATRRPCRRALRGALAILLAWLTWSGVPSLAAIRPKPAKRPTKSQRSSRKFGSPKQRSGTRSKSRSRNSRGLPRRVRIDPVSRLSAISSLASTLSRGSSALSYTGSLDTFYAALAQHEDQPDEDTVRVLQFGDSHTAADLFTGEARRVLQHQFGNGSIGYSYAGHPFAGYRIFGSQRTQSGGWETTGTHFADLGDGLLGMGGISMSTARAGEFITLDAPCTSLELEFLQQPNGGSLHLTDNGTPAPDISTAGESTGPGTYTYTCPESTTDSDDHHFVFTTATDSPVRLLGLVALQPGVTWEAIGINGAEAPLLLRWDQILFTTYLHNSNPSLIVLAYGTNEAAAHMNPDTYATTFGRVIDTLHRTAPDASVLVLGPTDRATASRRTWHAFAGTDPILDAQRTVCRTHNCAFWDQRRRMGGFGSMGQWVRAGWAQNDHTHLTGEGYRSLADALLADLLSGYDMYRKQHGLPSSSSAANAVQQEQGPPTSGATEAH